MTLRNLTQTRRKVDFNRFGCVTGTEFVLTCDWIGGMMFSGGKMNRSERWPK